MRLDGVRVTTGSRLHISLIDLEGATSKRVDGGVGFSIREPLVAVTVRPRPGRTIEVHAALDGGDDAVVLARVAMRSMQSRYGLGGASVTIEHSAPSHSGLGSGTQLAMATATAYTRAYDFRLPNTDIAQTVGRGGTSGIGVATFSSGGFVVDSGHRFASKERSFLPSCASRSVPPPPVVCRFRMPDWPVLIALPGQGIVVAAEREVELFWARCPIPLADVGACSHVILMTLVPAVLERDLAAFCRGISRIQELSWKRFEIEQQTPTVRELMRFMTGLGLEGVGLTSWGPAVYALGERLLAPDARRAAREGVVRFLADRGGGTCWITSSRNRGASVARSGGRA